MRSWFSALLLASTCAQPSGAVAPGRSEFVLPNGLRVRLAPDGDDTEVFVVLGLRAGFQVETRGRPHLAHVAEHMVVFGGRPGSDEAKAGERWVAEGRANGETNLPYMYFDIRAKPEDLGAALRVQASRLGTPEVAREVLDREAARALGEAEGLDRSDGGFTAKFASIAFVQAALLGTAEIRLRESSRGFRPDDVRDFWARAARPDRSNLCVAGAFDPDSARREIEAAFGAIPSPSSPPPTPPAALKPGRVDATWDLRARHLLIAWPAPPPSDPDHAALTLASLALAQRLFVDPEIAALAKLPLVANDADGLFLINAYLRPGADAGSLEAKIHDRVARLSGPRSPGDSEIAGLRMAAGQMLGLVDVETVSLPPGISRSTVRVNVELQRLLKELSWGEPIAYQARLDAVSARSFREAATRHLDPAKATIVRLGPPR